MNYQDFLYVDFIAIFFYKKKDISSFLKKRFAKNWKGTIPDDISTKQFVKEWSLPATISAWHWDLKAIDSQDPTKNKKVSSFVH